MKMPPIFLKVLNYRLNLLISSGICNDFWSVTTAGERFFYMEWFAVRGKIIENIFATKLQVW